MNIKHYWAATLALSVFFVSLSEAALAERDRPFLRKNARFQEKTNYPPAETISVDGVVREYYLHKHDRDRLAGGPAPTIFVLHGGADTPEKIRDRMLFDNLADREGFNVVYPRGFEKSWNDGRPDSARFRSTGEEPPDDVAFFNALIDKLVEDGTADPDKVYFTGPSNGGAMSMRVGCELSHKVAAIAPMIANMPEELGAVCKPGRPLPVLIMNGTEDKLMPWSGGAVGGKSEKGVVWSTLKTVEFWKENNGCADNAKTIRLPDRDRRDGSTVEIDFYQDCLNGAQVQLYRLIGAGHTVPGGKEPRFPRLVKRQLGNKNNDIDARVVLWNFFQ